MPSLQGRLLNAAVRLFMRRRYGLDEYALVKRARPVWGSPRVWQWLHSRGLIIKTVSEKGVSGEWLQTGDAERRRGALFYIHGGGFVSCSAETHRPITATLARETRLRVFSLEYRLAPEDRFPAALDDAFAAYRWLLAQENIEPSKIAVAGDSAGGGLVLSLLLRLRDEKLPLPACAACFSPWADLAGTGESVRVNAERDDLFYPENIQEFANAYLGETPPDNLYASPVSDDFRGLPPILFHVGSTEILLDDARRIHRKIQASGGVEAGELEIFEDIFHCWQMAVGFVPEARDSLAKAAAFIRRHV
ncbi:MAG TPA: alpha/beta hydrolase [Pyrinomonadaceae bacterium]|nr:alpha/beta hydrolase [Pyrinomonadaceae bacterium]